MRVAPSQAVLFALVFVWSLVVIIVPDQREWLVGPQSPGTETTERRLSCLARKNPKMSYSATWKQQTDEIKPQPRDQAGSYVFLDDEVTLIIDSQAVTKSLDIRTNLCRYSKSKVSRCLIRTDIRNSGLLRVIIDLVTAV
jgi:hypothetical protein